MGHPQLQLQLQLQLQPTEIRKGWAQPDTQYLGPVHGKPGALEICHTDTSLEVTFFFVPFNASYISSDHFGLTESAEELLYVLWRRLYNCILLSLSPGVRRCVVDIQYYVDNTLCTRA